jgi:hypothetical protein
MMFFDKAKYFSLPIEERNRIGKDVARFTTGFHKLRGNAIERNRIDFYVDAYRDDLINQAFDQKELQAEIDLAEFGRNRRKSF